MMVASPCVRQCVGTDSTSPPKKRALSIRVCRVSVLMRVREASEDPGSLNRDVPVGADPEDLQIDAARFADRVLVRRACCRDVGGQAVGALDRAGSEVDPGHEHLVDHLPIPLRMIGGQTDVLVEGEAAGLPK